MKMKLKSIVLVIALVSVLVLRMHMKLPNKLFGGIHENQGLPATVGEITLPPGFTRVPAGNHDVGFFFRQLDLKQKNNNVYLYNGQLKNNQSAQYAVLTLDVGNRDLQQCADAVMRLRAEYLYSLKRYDSIHFNFLSDAKPHYYVQFAKGDYSRKRFRKYLDYIFAFANTSSLKDELAPVANTADIRIGDVLIQKGKPYGHAVTVMDMAVDNSGQKIILISQSYMPAQEIHVLINPRNDHLSPWYKVKKSGTVLTPEWKFSWNDLMRFPGNY